MLALFVSQILLNSNSNLNTVSNMLDFICLLYKICYLNRNMIVTNKNRQLVNHCGILYRAVIATESGDSYRDR